MAKVSLTLVYWISFHVTYSKPHLGRSPPAPHVQDHQHFSLYHMGSSAYKYAVISPILKAKHPPDHTSAFRDHLISLIAIRAVFEKSCPFFHFLPLSPECTPSKTWPSHSVETALGSVLWLPQGASDHSLVSPCQACQQHGTLLVISHSSRTVFSPTFQDLSVPSSPPASGCLPTPLAGARSSQRCYAAWPWTLVSLLTACTPLVILSTLMALGTI